MLFVCSVQRDFPILQSVDVPPSQNTQNKEFNCWSCAAPVHLNKHLILMLPKEMCDGDDVGPPVEHFIPALPLGAVLFCSLFLKHSLCVQWMCVSKWKEQLLNGVCITYCSKLRGKSCLTGVSARSVSSDAAQVPGALRHRGRCCDLKCKRAFPLGPPSTGWLQPCLASPLMIKAFCMRTWRRCAVVGSSCPPVYYSYCDHRRGHWFMQPVYFYLLTEC